MPISAAAAAAIGLGMQAAGAGMDVATSGIKNRKQYHYTRKLQGDTFRDNQAMALFNMDLQKQLWEQTGPVGMMEQLKKAGLNPSLMYGMGGAGGQTANAAQAQGLNAAPIGGAGGEGYGLQLAQAATMTAKANAEVELLQTQADKTKAETINIITQGELLKWDLDVKNTTKMEAIEAVTAEYRKKQHELQLLINQVGISDQTINEQVNIIKNNAIKSALENDQIRAQMNLTEEQAKAIPIQLEQKARELDQQQFIQEIQANYPGLMNVLGKEVNDLVNGIIEKAGGGKAKDRRTEKR